MKAQRVSVGEDELSVSVRTGSPTLLFLHGLAGHGGEWDRVIGQLSPEIGIINPDQRAHGDSWLQGVRHVDRSQYVDDAVALVERLAAEPVVIVGQSMGGIVATLLAHARPDLVSRVVLVEAGMAALSESDLTELRLWFDSWPEVFADEAEAAIFFGPDERSTPAWMDGLEKTGTGLMRRFDEGRCSRRSGVWLSNDRWSEWEHILAPTTLIRGSVSMVSDADVAQMIELRPDTELIVVEDSSHDVHLDQPERVAVDG